MKTVKIVLAVVGGVTLLICGVISGSGMVVRAFDPQSATATANRPISEVREAVLTYLTGATEFSDRARVDTLSDGSINLIMGPSKPFHLTMSVALQPSAGSVKATATYNADRLAWSQPDKVLSTNLHRCFSDDFQRLIAEIHNGQFGRRLDLDGVMARARRSSRTVGCAA